MKKLLILILLLPFLLCSCMTANQLEAEKAFYQMLMAKQAQTTPLVRLDVADPNKPINLKTIEVFAPPSNTPISQYTQKDYVQPWLNVLSMAVPWLGVWGVSTAIMDGVTKMGNNTSMNITGTGNSGTMVGPTSNTLTGTGHTAGGIVDTTHPAQVVIVDPVVVNPVIVDPVVVRP